MTPVAQSTERLTIADARRLAIRAQGLDGPLARRRPRLADLRSVAERLGALQLDPTSVVARSQHLVLFSRLGAFDVGLLDELAYRERAVFDFWAHEASLCCTVDLPVHRWWMRAWPGPQPTARGRRWSAWLADHDHLARHVLDQLRERGASRLRDLGARRRGWLEAWGTPDDVGRAVDLLWLRGEVGVARREPGGERVWDLFARCLPGWAPGEELSERAAVRRAALRALRALGVARAAHVREHFTRGRYPGLPAVLDGLVAEGLVRRVAVEGLGDDWLTLADAAVRDDFRGRTVILSPFDNLLADRARARALFAFDHRLEIYVPAAKRRWGYYVAPVLHGDRLLARLDARFERGRLVVRELFPEPRAPRGVARGLRRELERLAAWRGATEIEIGAVPDAWRAVLAG